MLTSAKLSSFSGMARCSCYAFGPNKLGYCGPDKNKEILAYIKNKSADIGLKSLLEQFNTLRPYLSLIAKANSIKNIFDERVVEAYWIGNELLDNVEKRKLYNHLVDDHNIKKRIDLKSFRVLEEKMTLDPVPHHSFHVFNIWRRTGHLDENHTLQSMDYCRISWGKIKEIKDGLLIVETQPIILSEGKLLLGPSIKKDIRPEWGTKYKVGDIISMHWGVPCEIISDTQAFYLKKYTEKCISIFNQ